MTSQTVPAFRTFSQRLIGRLSHPLWAAVSAALAGCANVLAFAPFRCWPLQLVSMALLIQLCRRASVKRAAWLGWSYGFAGLYLGVSWLLVAMVRYGEMPAVIAVPTLALLPAFLGLFSALTTGGMRWLQLCWNLGERAALLLVWPALWALSEVLRGWLFTGFPWLSSGYAHTDSPLAGYAPLLGVYGMGGLVALLAASLARWRDARLSLPLAVALLAGGWSLQQVHWTQPQGKPITVSLLQGNVAQDIKFSEAHIVDSLVLYEAMLQAAPADLVATPETALPLLSSQLPPDYLQRVAEFAKRSGSHVVLGMAAADPGEHYANSAFGFSPEAAGAAGDSGPAQLNYRYDKHHLVPFGEFVPYGFHWFVDMMRIPLGDFTRGGLLQAPFKVKDQYVMPDICYEDLFGGEIAAQLQAQAASGAPVAGILLNMSNLAWYGDSIAMPQHLQISRMRSLETGRPMLRATNTGATAVIGPDGKVQAELEFLRRASLHASVQGTTGLTPYIRYGNYGMLALAAVALAAAWLLRARTGSGR